MNGGEDIEKREVNEMGKGARKYQLKTINHKFLPVKKKAKVLFWFEVFVLSYLDLPLMAVYYRRTSKCQNKSTSVSMHYLCKWFV